MESSSKFSSHLEHFYVISVVFNPAGYNKRNELYYKFESHIKKFGINLKTVECIYGNQTEFSVTCKNNINHIQIRGEHTLWHKENLINIAIKTLPSNWKYVVWLDCDIEFLDPDWPDRIIEAFQKYDVIQVFKCAHFLGPDDSTLETHFSLAYSVVNEIPIDKRHYSLYYPHPGYGWGLSRFAYEKVGGLIDFGIVGSGDGHIAFALLNRVQESFPVKMFHVNYLKRLEEWQTVAYSFTVNGRFGFADCSIKHYFHGYREDRKYSQRMEILKNFDPINDIEYDSNGLIRLKDTENERLNGIVEKIKKYFFDRNEDRLYDESGSMRSKLRFKSVDQILEDAEKLKVIIDKEKSTMDNQNKIKEDKLNLKNQEMKKNKKVNSDSKNSNRKKNYNQPIERNNYNFYNHHTYPISENYPSFSLDLNDSSSYNINNLCHEDYLDDDCNNNEVHHEHHSGHRNERDN